MGENLLWAVKNGELDEVEKLVSESKHDPNDSVKGKLLLVTASDYGHVAIIEYLISIGANVNQPDNYGITPLLAAIYEEHVEAVKVLLKNGAEKSQQTPDGRSYFDAANDAIKSLLK
uniref:Myotrophin-like n=1 Tax=Phallusia mammillata TaxID=59560 RepID=A0A6F9DB08_9ASCI|nr:myotrophin-like [Phallusia mammillata]